MKYIKLFMLMLVASAFMACSDDDAATNTLPATAGFERAELSVKENVGYVNIPIAVNGYRNGDISVTVSVEGTGSNPAVESKHFQIVEKELHLLAKNDTTGNAQLNVQLQAFDDTEINDPRELTIHIVAASGVEVVDSKSIKVTLRDNDAAFFEKFYGKWMLTAKNSEGNDFKANVTISGPTDEDDADYNHYLTATSKKMFDVGVALDCDWTFEYSFDKESKTGKLGFVCGTLVSSYGDTYQWTWTGVKNDEFSSDNVEAEWQLGENDAFPSVITWPEDAILVLYQPGAGWWEMLDHLVLTKQ